MDTLKGRTILIVEDEYYLAADLAQLVRRGGGEVLGPCPDQQAALSLLSSRRPQCAVLDVNLGRGAGFELAERLQELSVPFLFFTGYDQEMIPPRFADVVRLEKPVGDAKLLGAIEALCG